MTAHRPGWLGGAATCAAAIFGLGHVAVGGLQLATVRPLDAARSLPYFVSHGDPRTGYRPPDRELAIWAFEAWEQGAAGALHLQPAPEADARVRLYWSPPDGGSYGVTRPLGSGSGVGAAVFVRPGVEQLDTVIARRAAADPLFRDTVVYLTCLHEIGHALGLEHTADDRDIMYSFGYGGDIVEYFARYRRRIAARRDIPSTPGLSDADAGRLQALKAAP